MKDLFFHTGVCVKDTLSEIVYDNKYNILNNNNISDRLLNLEVVDINIFNIPFRIYYQETKDNQEQISTYLQDIGIFLNKKINEAYVVCKMYTNCKCLSLNIDMVKKFINIISNVIEEEEIKEMTKAYHFENKELRTENTYISFDDFYWKIKESF